MYHFVKDLNESVKIIMIKMIMQTYLLYGVKANKSFKNYIVYLNDEPVTLYNMPCFCSI